MAHHGKFVLSVAVLLALLEFGSCLHCYQCNSEEDKNCADPFKSKKPAVDCATQDAVNYNNNYLSSILPREFAHSPVGAPRYCHKFVLDTGVIVRTCLDAHPSDISQTCRTLKTQTISSADPAKRIVKCDVCDKENCNGASSIAFSLPIATAALLVSYLFCKQ